MKRKNKCSEKRDNTRKYSVIQKRGDVVRKKISFDLGYDLKDRIIQTKRLFGISEILISNNFFPILSSSYLGMDVSKLALKKKYLLLNVKRKKELLKKRVFNLNKNVVGKDIKLPKINCKVITNDHNIETKINKIIKLID